MSSALPASAAYPIGQRISAAGVPYYASIILVATDTGLAYKLTIAGSPAAVVITPIPDVATIRLDFATVVLLRATVPSVAQLRTWGF